VGLVRSQGDSGWILPTLETDVSIAATWMHLGYRRLGGVVYLVLNLTIANAAVDKLLFTLPAEFRPKNQDGSRKLILGAVSGTLLRVSPMDGTVRANSATTSTIVCSAYPLR
jgi:hypothetical protein